MSKLSVTAAVVTMLGATFVHAQSAEETSQEVAKKASSLTANLERLALQYNQNSVTNKEDDNYPGSYSADEQEVFTGIFDGNITYNNDALVWANSLFMEYGKSKSTEDGTTTKSETADKILLTTDYTQKLWTLEQGIIGPFASLGYETEFTTFKGEDGEDYRTKILRAKTGLKLYEGKYFKELYAAAVEEADFTYGKTNMKTAGEVGYKFEYIFRDDMKFISSGYFRKYFVYDAYRNTDFKYEAETDNRLEVAIVGGLSFAPFVDYKIAKTRGAQKERSNTTVGLSLGYQTNYNFW